MSFPTPLPTLGGSPELLRDLGSKVRFPKCEWAPGSEAALWQLSGTTGRGAGLTGALHTPLMQLSLGDRGQGHCDLWKPAQPYTTVPRLPERTGGGSGAMGCQVPSSAAPYSVAQLCAFSSQLSPCLSGRDCLCAKARDPSRSGLRWFCMDLLAACPVSASGARVPPARQQDMRTLLCDPVEQGGAVHSLSPVREETAFIQMIIFSPETAHLQLVLVEAGTSRPQE